MIIDSNKTVSITTFNQKLSSVLKDVEEKKDIVIMRRNKPAFVIMDFKEYERIKSAFLLNEADSIMEEYEKALKELAK
jgi:antitoxin Phd